MTYETLILCSYAPTYPSLNVFSPTRYFQKVKQEEVLNISAIFAPWRVIWQLIPIDEEEYKNTCNHPHTLHQICPTMYYLLYTARAQLCFSSKKKLIISFRPFPQRQWPIESLKQKRPFFSFLWPYVNIFVLGRYEKAMKV